MPVQQQAHAQGPHMSKSNLRPHHGLINRMRSLPDFIIIGAQKSGTTSLYNFLAQHPLVIPATTKEIHFFDNVNNNFARGRNWYRSHFPSSLYKIYKKATHKQGFITGEASPYYIFHPLVPRRISEMVPRVKLIVLLRNPLDRAYSHYQHNVRMGREPLSFEEAIDSEEERLEGEIEKMLVDQNYWSFNHQHFSYRSRGIYIDQLRAWQTYFTREQILVLGSEDFYSNLSATYNKALTFLNLPNWGLVEYGKHNYWGRYQLMDATTKKRLLDYFEPYNKELYDFLGIEFDWDG